jgi:general stress protein 26
MNTTTSPAEQRDHFLSLLHKFHSAMLVTTTSTGELHARPMAMAEVESDARIWFITGAESPKVREIEEDCHVTITAQNSDCFLALSGRAQLIRDPQKVQEIWREPFRVWFPTGATDPTIELISVTPARGEYWDTGGSHRVSYLWEAAISYLSGTTPNPDAHDQHAKVEL